MFGAGKLGDSSAEGKMEKSYDENTSMRNTPG